MLATLGAWAAGWHWATSEPGGGGPISTWCCENHSVFLPEDADATPTVERVVASVAEWQALLQQLDARFGVLRDTLDGLPLAEATEHAAADLLVVVIARTHCQDAWYATFTLVLSWYLESMGLLPEEARGVVAPLISGCFESWLEPSPAASAETCRALGHVLAAAFEAPSQVAEASTDALQAWVRLRSSCFTAVPAEASARPVSHDSHARYIQRWDVPRSLPRAEGMRRALAQCRADAAAQVPLTFETLRAWQALLLDDPNVAFRTGPAAAKQGRERYGFDASTQPRFEACLAEASDATQPIAVRAARVYLDVCFFHPFPDGNGRAARLALDYCLTREGLALHAVEPVFVLSRGATDSNGVWRLGFLIGRLMGTSVLRACR